MGWSQTSPSTFLATVKGRPKNGKIRIPPMLMRKCEGASESKRCLAWEEVTPMNIMVIVETGIVKSAEARELGSEFPMIILGDFIKGVGPEILWSQMAALALLGMTIVVCRPPASKGLNVR